MIYKNKRFNTNLLLEIWKINKCQIMTKTFLNKYLKKIIKYEFSKIKMIYRKNNFNLKMNN